MEALPYRILELPAGTDIKKALETKLNLKTKTAKGIQRTIESILGGRKFKTVGIYLKNDEIIVEIRLNESINKKSIYGIKKKISNNYKDNNNTMLVFHADGSFEYQELVGDNHVRENHSIEIKPIKNPSGIPTIFDISFGRVYVDNNEHHTKELKFTVEFDSKGIAMVTSEGELLSLEEFLKPIIGDEVKNLGLEKSININRLYEVLGNIGICMNIAEIIEKAEINEYNKYNSSTQIKEVAVLYLSWLLENSDDKNKIASAVSELFNKKGINININNISNDDLRKLSLEEIESILAKDEDHYKKYIVLKEHLEANKDWVVDEISFDDEGASKQVKYDNQNLNTDFYNKWLSISCHSLQDEKDIRELFVSMNSNYYYLAGYQYHTTELSDENDGEDSLKNIGYIDDNGKPHLYAITEALYSGLIKLSDEISPVLGTSTVRGITTIKDTGKHIHNMAIYYQFKDAENLYTLSCIPVIGDKDIMGYPIIKTVNCVLMKINIKDYILNREKYTNGEKTLEQIKKSISVDPNKPYTELFRDLCSGKIQKLAGEMRQEMRRCSKDYVKRRIAAVEGLIKEQPGNDTLQNRLIVLQKRLAKK